MANFDGNYTYSNAVKGTYLEKSKAVDSFDPNAFGLYNMHGNVWEWCLDPWHSDYTNAPSDDLVWDASNYSGSKSRLIRGGSWRNRPGSCRSAYRYNGVLAYRLNNLGFRVVCLFSQGPS